MLWSSSNKSRVRKWSNHPDMPHPSLHDNPDNPGGDSGEWNYLIYPHLSKYLGGTVPSTVSEAQQVDVMVLSTGPNELRDAIPWDEP